MEKIGLDFKLIIAYLIPGSIGLYAAAMLIPAVEALLGGSAAVPQGASIVLVLVLAIASGMIINALTWALVRPLIEKTGVPRPKLEYSNLTKENEASFRNIIDNNFSYYQSYANMFTALVALFASYIYSEGLPRLDLIIPGGVICIVLFIAARDSLKRSYQEMEKILSKAPASGSGNAT